MAYVCVCMWCQTIIMKLLKVCTVCLWGSLHTFKRLFIDQIVKISIVQVSKMGAPKKKDLAQKKD